MIRTLAGTAAFAVLCVSVAAAQPPTPPNFHGQAEFHDRYKDLIETNTTASAGSCTIAATGMAARLRVAGYPDSDLQLLIPPNRPQDGNLIAALHGSELKAKAILLLAHIDVVEAKREDWQRDPFKLVEENGYLYARGASDDKVMAASFTDAIIRYRKEGFKPRRSIKLALTCGEETPDTFNGAHWLMTSHRADMDAAFALNEGAGGRLDGDKRVYPGIQAGERVYQDYTWR